MAALDRMSVYLTERIERDESPIYLHEIAFFLAIYANQGRRPAVLLSKALEKSVKEMFDKDEADMRPEIREMSLYRIVQILRALP